MSWPGFVSGAQPRPPIAEHPSLQRHPRRSPAPATMAATPPIASIPRDNAVDLVNNGALERYGCDSGGVVFTEHHSLDLYPINERLMVVVRDRDGDIVGSIPDESKSYHETVIVTAANVTSTYMSARVCVKPEEPDKATQAMLMAPIYENPASVRLFEEMRRIYSPAFYTSAVEGSALHALHKSKLLKKQTVAQTIARLHAKGKLYVPCRLNEDSGNAAELFTDTIRVKHKCFKKKPAPRDTDFSTNPDVVAFLEGEHKKHAADPTADVLLGVDPVPIAAADGVLITNYEPIRALDVSLMQLIFRPDFVSAANANVSFGVDCRHMQALTVTTAESRSTATAVDFMAEYTRKRTAADASASDGAAGGVVNDYVQEFKRQRAVTE